jgi:hypothetical protein
VRQAGPGPRHEQTKQKNRHAGGKNQKPTLAPTALRGSTYRGYIEHNGPLGTCLSEDDELRQLMEGVAEAGSWAVWTGVFSKSWMKLLVAGGLTSKRARIVTGNR